MTDPDLSVGSPADVAHREELESYFRDRRAAQARKIQLSMDRKRGRVTGRSPRDRALMSETVEVESEYDPKRW